MGGMETEINRELFRIPGELISREGKAKNILPEYRSEFMRDRDRILYSTAFRRLTGKTQIYTVGIDDHKRNRLTHTMEVAQIARTIARALNLDEALAEAIALGHDLGHTPFGHAGERMLHEIMIPGSNYCKMTVLSKKNLDELTDLDERDKKVLFGFKHNIQSVRVVCKLEDSYEGAGSKNLGLNLTNYVLWGILSHSELKYKDDSKILEDDKATEDEKTPDDAKSNEEKRKQEEKKVPNYVNQFSDLLKCQGVDGAWSFEAFVVKWSDEIAQWHHDLEDAIRSNALPMKTVCKNIESIIGEKLSKDDKNLLEKLKKSSDYDRAKMAKLSHIVVNTLVNDLIITSRENLAMIQKLLDEDDNASVQAFSYSMYTDYENNVKKKIGLKKENVISISKDIKQKEFEKLISSSVHHSLEVERMNGKGTYIIRKLFEAYYTNPQQLPTGPIRHFLVDAGVVKTLKEAKDKPDGKIRTEFNKKLKKMRESGKENDKDNIILMRRICDHIASMTDAYAIHEYNNLYG